jgi:hypothetical protein
MMDACGGEFNHILAAIFGSGEPDQTAPRPPLHLSPVFQTVCACANVGSDLACRSAQLSSAEFEPRLSENVELMALTNGFVPVLGRCGVVVIVLGRCGVVVIVLGRCGVVVIVLGRCGVDCGAVNRGVVIPGE